MKKAILVFFTVLGLILTLSVVQTQANIEKAFQNGIDYLKDSEFEDSLYWFNLVVEENPSSFLAKKARIHWLTIKSGISSGLNLLSLYYLQGQSKALKDTNKFAEKTQKDYWNNHIEALKESFSHLSEFSKKLSLWEEDIKAERINLDYVYRNSEAIVKLGSLKENISSGNEFLLVSFHEAEEVFIKAGITMNYHAITGHKNEFLKPSFEGKIDFPEFWYTMGL